MGRNKKTAEKKTAEKVAEELAEVALARLSSFSEEEQTQRIATAEKRLATSRAGSPRTASSTAPTRSELGFCPRSISTC